MKEKIAFSYLFKMFFVVSLLSISPSHVRRSPDIIKEVENSEGLYSCLITEGPVLDQWKNEIKIFSLYEGLYMKWKGVLTCFFHFVLYFDL